MLKNSKTLMFFLAAALILVVMGIAQQPSGATTAKDPVCGMSVKIDGAKYTADYKGTKYYFCSEGCKTEFTKSPEKYLGQTANATAKDPVCGMTVKIDGAKYTADYKGTKYYFCSEGCKTEFSKNPEKYLAPGAAAKPMGGMMMHGMPANQAEMDSCPMMMKDVEKTFANTKDGVTITLSAKSPEAVKKIQDWAAKMKEGKDSMGGHGEGDCPMGANCPKMKK